VLDDDDPLPNEQSEAEQRLAENVDVEIPGVEAPEVEIPDESDASPELRRQFWWLVFVFNGALAGVSVGAMLVAFRGSWDLGGSMLAAGVVLFVYGYVRYRGYTRDGESRKD
jgi:hypothetical protein